MPDPKKSYKVNGEVYDIPQEKADAFLKKYPAAQQVQSYTVNKDTFDIPVQKVNNFMAKYPNAKPLGYDSQEVKQQSQQPAIQAQQQDNSIVATQPPTQDNSAPTAAPVAPIFDANSQLGDVKNAFAEFNKPVKKGLVTNANLDGNVYAEDDPEDLKRKESAGKQYDAAVADFATKIGEDKNNVEQTIKDFPSELRADEIKRFTQLRSDNKLAYDRAIPANKNLFAIANTDAIPKNDAIHLANEYNQLNDADAFVNLEGNTRRQQEIISQTLTGDKQKQALNNLKENKKVFFNSANPSIVDEYNSSPLKSTLSADQYAGLKYQQVFEPDKYERNLRAIQTDVQPDIQATGGISAINKALGAPDFAETQESIDTRRGKETLLKSLAETGRNNAQSYFDEKVYDLDKAYKSGAITKEDAQQQYLQFKTQSDAISQDRIKDAQRYPLLQQLELDRQVKEITQTPEMNVPEYFMYRLGKGFENTGATAENLLTFGDEANARLQMKRLGQMSDDDTYSKLPTSQQAIQDNTMPVFSKQLQEEKNRILSLPISDTDKRQRIAGILKDNQSQVDYITNPNAGKHANFWSTSTAYGNAGMIGDVASIALQSAMGNELGLGKLLSNAAPMFTTAQNDFYKEAIANGEKNPDAYANLHGLVMAAAGLINPDIKIVKNALGLKSAAGKAIANIDESTWNSIIKRNPEWLQRFGNSAKSVLGEGAKIGAVYGAGTSIANDLINKGVFGQDISGEQIIDRAYDATKMAVIHSAGILGLGAITNFKSVSPTQKANLWEAGRNPEITLQQIEEAKNSGTITPEQAKQRADIVKDLSGIMQQVPAENAKGELLTDRQRNDYFYNLSIGLGAGKLKKELPTAQKEKVDVAEATADAANNLIFEPKTDKQLASRKAEIENQLAEKNEQGGFVVSLKDRVTLQGELEAINNNLEDKSKQSSVTIIRPEENKPNENITTTTQVEPTTPTEKSGVSITLPQSNRAPKIVEKNATNNEEANKPVEQSSVPAEEKSGAIETAGETKPTTEERSIPIKETKSATPKITVEYPKTKIDYRGTQDLSTEFGVTERTPTETKSDLQTVKNANNLLEDGFNVRDLMDKMQNENHKPSDEEYVILNQYAANLAGELRAIKDVTSSEFAAKLKEANRVAELSNIAGRDEARAFRMRGVTKAAANDNYAEYFLREQEANNGAPLTDNQKLNVQKEHEIITAADKDMNDKMAQLEAENAKLKAEAEFTKTKGANKKVANKTKEDFVKERKQIVDDIREKLRQSRGQANNVVTAVIDFAKIAPDVAKLVKSLAQEGIIKLDEVVKSVHSDLKDIIDGITEKDVHDIIAGEYNEKRKPRSQLAANLKDLRDEAALINKLEKLQAGQEPANERQKIKRNQAISELQKKIKNFGKEEEQQRKQDEKYATDEAKQKYAYEKQLAKIKAENIAKGEKEAKIKAAEQERAQEEAERIANKKSAEELILQAVKTRNERESKKVQEQIDAGNFEKESPKQPVLDNKELQKRFPQLYKDALAAKDKLIKLKQEREVRLLKQQYANRNKYEKTRDAIVEVANLPRALMSSVDYSAPLRQGAVLGVAHPEIAGKAFVEMFRQSFSQKRFDRWFYDVREHPLFRTSEKSGLYVADPHNPILTAKEEVFMSNLAEKIPLLGKLVKGSERAYVGYLNKLRWDVFNQFAEQFEGEGKTFDNSPELYKGLAKYINNATGRGDLGFAESAAPILNSTFFSPRLIASRVNLLNPFFYSKLPKEVRVEAIKGIAKFVGTGLTVLALAKYGFGAKVEDDPRSTDFGKIKDGNTRFDIWGGFQQYIRVISQLLSAETKSTTNGDIKKLDGNGMFGETRGDVLQRFARGKLAPVPSMLADFLKGKTTTGEDATITNEVSSHFLPLLFSDIHDAYKDKGIRGIFEVGIPSTFGVGVSTYDATAKPKISNSSSNRETKRSTNRETNRSTNNR